MKGKHSQIVPAYLAIKCWWLIDYTLPWVALKFYKYLFCSSFHTVVGKVIKITVSQYRWFTMVTALLDESLHTWHWPYIALTLQTNNPSYLCQMDFPVLKPSVPHSLISLKSGFSVYKSVVMTQWHADSWVFPFIKQSPTACIVSIGQGSSLYLRGIIKAKIGGSISFLTMLNWN